MPATRYGRDSSLPVRSSRIQCSRSSWVKVVVGAGERAGVVLAASSPTEGSGCNERGGGDRSESCPPGAS